MRKKNTESIGEVLKEYFEQNPFFKTKLAESRVITGWSKIFGPTINSYTSSIFLKQGVLYINLSSSILRAELLQTKDRLIPQLNKYAGMDIVKDIIFR